MTSFFEKVYRYGGTALLIKYKLVVIAHYTVGLLIERKGGTII